MRMAFRWPQREGWEVSPPGDLLLPPDLAKRRKGFALPRASHFFRGEKVTKTPLRGMKLSDLIAKGRRTVLKISPPKNPHYYGGTPCGQTGSHWRRVVGELPLR